MQNALVLMFHLWNPVGMMLWMHVKQPKRTIANHFLTEYAHCTGHVNDSHNYGLSALPFLQRSNHC